MSSVHATAPGAPGLCMTINGQATPGDQARVQAGDPEWVADLFDTFRAGDLDVAVDSLDALLRRMRRAAKARRVLTGLQPGLLRQGREISANRQGSDR